MRWMAQPAESRCEWGVNNGTGLQGVEREGQRETIIYSWCYVLL